MQRLAGLWLVMLVVAGGALYAADEKPPKTPYGVLYDEWKGQVKTLDANAEISKAEKRERKQRINAEFTPRFVKLAKEHLKDELWVQCLIWISVQGTPGPDLDEMCDIFAENVDAVRFQEHQFVMVMPEFIKVDSKRIGPALAKISEKSQYHSVRGAALYALAVRTKREAEERGDVAGCAQAEKLFQRILADYPKVFVRSGDADEAAKQLLEDLRGPVALGKTVPMTKGKTLAGEDFDLVETVRGKVTVVAFSGHWCGPCVAMHPVQKEILAKFPADKVAVVEMNSDQAKALDQVRAKNKADGLDWLLVTDGPDGPISNQWFVTAWPTYFVIDAEGKIRRRVVGNVGRKLVEWVEELVVEAGNEAGR